MTIQTYICTSRYSLIQKNKTPSTRARAHTHIHEGRHTRHSSVHIHTNASTQAHTTYAHINTHTRTHIHTYTHIRTHTHAQNTTHNTHTRHTTQPHHTRLHHTQQHTWDESNGLSHAHTLHSSTHIQEVQQVHTKKHDKHCTQDIHACIYIHTYIHTCIYIHTYITYMHAYITTYMRLLTFLVFSFLVRPLTHQWPKKKIIYLVLFHIIASSPVAKNQNAYLILYYITLIKYLNLAKCILILVNFDNSRIYLLTVSIIFGVSGCVFDVLVL